MDNQTIIVKKIKKGGHGHHGGAWKVAFADFVTAMMAFFMLLWLLSSASKEELAGISEYFTPTTTGISEGDGSRESIVDFGGGQRISQGVDFMDPASQDVQEALEQEQQREQERLESLMEDIKQAIESSDALKAFKDQLLLDITAEGLRIQIVDKENRPMFDIGADELKSYTKEILHELGKTINKVPNRISLTGHTDAARFVSRKGYTNWELSADRANASRRELVIGGLSEDKIAKVVGLASMVPFDRDDPRSPINRRISIIVMNKAAEQALLNEGVKVQNEQDAQRVLEDGEHQGIGGALETLQPAEKPAATAADKPAPPKENDKPKAPKKSAAVELAPASASNDEGIAPIINPIQLPKIPGTD